MQAAHGAGAAQESLSSRIPRWGTSRIISGIFAVDRDALEDIVCKSALGLARGRLDICRESVRGFMGQWKSRRKFGQKRIESRRYISRGRDKY